MKGLAISLMIEDSLGLLAPKVGAYQVKKLSLNGLPNWESPIGDKSGTGKWKIAESGPTDPTLGNWA